jgi:hypothetical protein
MRPTSPSLFPIRARLTAAALLLALSAPARAAVAQGAAEAGAEGALPFAVGDTLTFSARVSKVGRVGKAGRWVDGPSELRGTAAWVLHFAFSARVGPVKAEDRTESWLDARTMTALRFHKHERHPLSRHDERVELFPADRRWQSDDGQSGESPTAAPLDELSFMFFLRTLPLDADTTFVFERHFDPARNPTIVRVVGRERVTTGAGEFQTVKLEMRVRDPRRYRGEGVIRINLTDDAHRLPVRIESEMPMIGKAVLSLESSVSGARGLLARR